MRPMDFSPSAYTDGLTFAADVTDAATHIAHGDHGANRLREPLVKELAHREESWSWSDNPQDEHLISGGALRATVLYLADRHAVGMPSLAGDVAALWPDADARVASLRRALMVAVEAAGHRR